MSNNGSGAARQDLVHDLLLPTLLFAALGGMVWAVRGCSGFGALNGCVFAGVTWGAAWWFIAREPSGQQSRRYASGWIILALTVGIGLSGARGWMQWPSFFNGHLQTNYEQGKWVPIPRSYGFIWLFIAGVPWAGIGACLLAWCGSRRPTRAWQWALRLACGFGVSYIAVYLFNHFPEIFLPLYKTMKAQYLDVQSNPNLRRLTGDNRAALQHLGFYLGFLLFEVGRRDWKNVKLILTVGLVNGLGWAACQNWQWAARVWPDGHFNFWRCWESTGGISIGIAYGLAYYVANRKMPAEEKTLQEERLAGGRLNLEWLGVYLLLLLALALFFVPALHGGWGRLYFTLGGAFAIGYYLLNRAKEQGNKIVLGEDSYLERVLLGVYILAVVAAFGVFFTPTYAGSLRVVFFTLACGFGIGNYLLKRGRDAGTKFLSREDPNLERLGAYLGLLLGLGMSIRNGLKGWFNIYKENERYWDGVLWQIAGPVLLACLIAILVWLLRRPLPRGFPGDAFPHAYGLIWLVLIVQNAIAQLITGPHSSWPETAFAIYYLLLFFITAVIIYHFHYMKTRRVAPEPAPHREAEAPVVSAP
jgi:hypothetical protein